MVSSSVINTLEKETKDYQRAVSTVNEIVNLFRHVETSYGGFNPPIVVEKVTNAHTFQKYRLTTSRVLVGHIEVDAVFEIDIQCMYIHTLAMNSKLHNDIRKNLAEFLSVYHGQEYRLEK